MRRFLCVMLFALGGFALAQSPNSTLPTPRISSVFPSGARIGTTLEVTILGTDIEDATRLLTAHPGITAERIVEEEPKPDPKKKDTSKGNRTASATGAKFKVTVKSDVPPGQYDVRVVGRLGISNPRIFTVGTRPEVNEVNPNNDVPQAQRVELGTVINGVIEATTDVDYSVFAGKKDQRVIIHCAASSIDSRARPLVEVFAADGKTRVGLNRNYQGTDALVDVTLPSDGDYYIRVSEFAYVNGGPEYFYRLTVGTGSWIDTVYPPMIDPSKDSPLTLIGRDLKSGKETGAMILGRPVMTSTSTHAALAKPALMAFTGPLTLPLQAGLADGVVWNGKPLFFATAPIVLEAMGDNDTAEKAQLVPVPCEVAGCIYTRNDRDFFKFEAKKGDVFMIELQADRIGSNIDAYLSVRNPNSNEIAGESQLDDDPESIHPTSFFSKTTDPAPYKFTASADGQYTIMVATRDGNMNYGPRSIYRLRISPPKPDYRVVAMPRHRDLPSSLVVKPSSETALDVFVQRIDGFNGPVTVTLNNLPAGVTAKPATIGTGQRWGTLLLSGDKELKDTECLITATASARIDDKEVKRDCRSASITWGIINQQGGPTLARLDQFLPLATRGGDKTPFRIVTHFEKASIKGTDGKERPATVPWVVKPGDRITLPVNIEWLGEGARPNIVNLGMEPTKMEQNLNPLSVNNGQLINVAKDKNEANVVIEVRTNAPPGQYMVALRGDTKANMLKDAMTKEKKEYTVMTFAAPFPVTVVPMSLGKLLTSQAQVKVGQSAPLTIRVERAFDYMGEFPVKITFPTGSGLSAPDTVIPAGKNDVTVSVTATKEAKPATVANVIVQSTVNYEGKHATSHETKATVVITK